MLDRQTGSTLASTFAHETAKQEAGEKLHELMELYKA